MPPQVSVVIPAYNKGRTIGATIQSALEQTFTDLEAVVIDDGSTDDTRQQVERFGARVRYAFQERGGVAKARNHGLELAQSEYVAFLDADDLWLPKKIELQLACLEQDPGLDAVQCGVYFVDNQLRVLEARSCNPAQDTWLDVLLFRNLPGFGSTVLARRSRLMDLGGFGTDLVILEDWDLACRLARTGGLRSLPEALVLYRQHPGNRSRNIDIHVEPGFRSLGRLFDDPTLDPVIRAHEAMIWARFYAMLARGYVRNGQWGRGAAWAARALRTSPRVAAYLMGPPMRRLRASLSSPRPISFAEELSFGVIP